MYSQKLINSFLFVFLSFLFSSSVLVAQPTIDGNFDGVGVWGTPVSVADGAVGWSEAMANAKNLYVTESGPYVYLGAEVTASTWMAWAFIIHTTTGGGTADTWSRSIDYAHSESPDYIFRGHFDGYAEFHSWNGSDWDGIGSALSSTEYGENISGNLQDGWIEIRILKTAIGGVSAADIQFYLTGDENHHGAFDSVPDDNFAGAWDVSNPQDRTQLTNYETNVVFGGGGGGGSIVTITPSTPTATEQVVIEFDATGTALEGAAQVYIHSGVSITEADATKFDRVVGNWGQDDGFGEMTNTSGNIWEITLTSLQDYYGVDETEDVFGLNFLFRSADGALKEDNGNNNYHNAVNTGPYFVITSPEDAPFLVETNTPFNGTATTSTTPSSWTLDEVDADGNIIAANISTQAGGNTFTHAFNLATTDLKRYKVTANFAGPIGKHKFIEIKPYSPVTLASRPAWVKPGINYHDDDPTKATLVLHAPTYTQFKKGDGSVSGDGNTTAKNVVYAIGDFNNWALDEAYKMNRDTDDDGDMDQGDYWWIELSGLTPGQEYVFQYFLEGAIQIADPYAEKISDPDDHLIANTTYPNLIAYPSDVAQDRASVLQTNQSEYNWTAPAFVRPTNNLLNIYELHFRDFTEEGTYLAAIDRLDYIKALGINAIHVLPVSEFEGNSSWGYNPNFYFAPDKAYGTKDDLKKFIDECHKKEIQVFNDVVLNHCFHSNVMARMYWDEALEQPRAENPWINATHRAIATTDGHWGVDWNHESEHTQVMIDRILDFWLQEYQFDGFRFDFTKGFTQTEPDGGDPWASSEDTDRIALLKRMVDGMWDRNPGSVAIFEHLADPVEDTQLGDHGILMWSGAGHHHQMKNFVLGWNDTSTDIFYSGFYNQQGFGLANWMSYMESHDEQRLAYELMENGNGIANETNPQLKVEKMIDRLKIGAAFNLLFPGPRMVWQFGELGYDVSINFNGRTGEKPVLWEYYDDPARRELYTLMSILFHIRNNYNGMAAQNPDCGSGNFNTNICLGAGNVTTPKYMRLTDGAGNYVIVIANTDPHAAQSINPGYQQTGTWYKYNGDTNVDGTSFNVNSTGDSYGLAPSETMVLTNFEINMSALAVELLNFGGEVSNKKALLNWETAKEENNQGFYIEKSQDGKNFEVIDFVDGQGSHSRYQYTDASFEKAAYYRLHQVDLDEKSRYSKVIFLSSGNDLGVGFQIYPNPVTNESMLTSNVPYLDDLQLELLSPTGEVLLQTKGSLENTNRQLQWRMLELTRGTYFVRIFGKSGATVLKIVKS